MLLSKLIKIPIPGCPDDLSDLEILLWARHSASKQMVGSPGAPGGLPYRSGRWGKGHSQIPEHPWVNSSCFSDSQSTGFKYLSSSSVCAQLWFLELITEFCHFYFHPNRALPLSVLNRPWGIFKSENHPEGGFLHRCAMNSYLLTKQVISVSEEILPV